MRPSRAQVCDELMRYFDVSRQIVERYGGTIEKFIGDAAVAVWGTPSAREDDAEHAGHGLHVIAT